MSFDSPCSRFSTHPEPGRRFLVLGILLLWGLAGQAFGDDFPDEWIEVRSENFTVLSDAGERRAKKVASHFEQIRALFTSAMPKLASAESPPLLVFAASDERTMKELLPYYWLDRKRMKPSGIFSRTPLGQLVVMRADLTKSGDFGLIYHEYFHFIVAEAGLRLPSWLSEGLADYWGGGAQLKSKHAEVGLPLPYRLQVLEGGRRLLPIEEFLAAGRGSPLYHDQAHSAYFYGQAWALTHMLISGGDEGELRDAFVRYLVLVENGADGLEAAKQVFGDLQELEDKLKTYVKRPGLPFARLPAPPKPDDETFKVREVPRSEAAALVIHRLPSGRTPEQMQDLVAIALDGSPDLAAVYEAQGQIHAGRGELAKCLESYEKALDASGTSAMSPYMVAVLRLDQAKKAKGEPSPEDLAQAEKMLMRSLEIDRRYTPAGVALADLYLEMEGRGDDALAAIRMAVIFSSGATGYRLKEAEILQRLGRDKDAFLVARGETQKTVESGNASRNNSVCWQGSLLGLAELVLPACNQAVALEPENVSFLDSRGVARALLGDLGGALLDFKAALAADDGDFEESIRAKRQAWVAQLEKGESPFAERGHRHLSEDIEEVGLGWQFLD